LSFIGGSSILLFVPNGPYRKAGQTINPTAFIQAFKQKEFRSASFGYFGHMWELYTFWAFVPVILSAYHQYYPSLKFNISLLSFCIIASGGIACVCSGILSQYFGVKKTAIASLSISCMCCIVSPFFLFIHSLNVLIVFLLIWGLAVIADSPLFSTLIAQHAPDKSRGTSLTIVNCIGFSITIISIQFINIISEKINAQYVYMFLAIGPLLGLYALLKKNNP
jgi:MFS family permease